MRKLDRADGTSDGYAASAGDTGLRGEPEALVQASVGRLQVKFERSEHKFT